MKQALSDESRRDWLRLARTEGIGPVTFADLLGRFGTPGRALENLPDLAKRVGRLNTLRLADLDAVETELEAGAALGAQLICNCEVNFPAPLAALDPPPPLIWARGRTDLLAGETIAIVGARIASAAGQRFARVLASELGEAGHVIVSGMARGIDAAAHEGALKTGTIAVLGGGIDDIYPPQNADLYSRLIETGCVVSESPPGHTATARDFPRRNRIIAGLSRAVVVVEAELRSGSLITARLAAEQGREVLAVPGSPLDPRARGCNDLIRQGAALCEGLQDVLRTLEDLPGFGGVREPDRAFQPNPDLVEDHVRDQIFDLLSPTPVSRDDLVRATGLPIGRINAALSELELADRITFAQGGAVALV